MKVWIRQFSIMMVAALMLFSTTGVAIYHHICGCHVPMSQTVKGSTPGKSCCSMTESSQEPSCCTDENHEACDPENPGRCRNEVIYLKAPIISTLPLEEQGISVIHFEIPDFRMPDSRLSEDNAIDEQPSVCNCLIPPRAGGSLVIFLHSIKIPFPEDLT